MDTEEKSAAILITDDSKQGAFVIQNCIIRPKEDQIGPMFTFDSDGKCIGINLVGYRIEPIDG